MRLFAVLAALAMTACTEAQALDPTGVEWELLAIDGQPVDIPATLSVDGFGAISGKAPCNSYGGQNAGSLPDLKLGGLRATKMACDRLSDEQVFFDALAAMTRLERISKQSLVLTGPDGRSMEFATDRASGEAPCSTCALQD